MYANFNDLCIFSREMGNIFDITYNANKSYCMVIHNEPQDKTNIHSVIINTRFLSHTDKCKYLGYIINNYLTDKVDIARQKRYLSSDKCFSQNRARGCHLNNGSML